MICRSETKDRFEVRAARLSVLLRDAGVSEQGPRTALPTFHLPKPRRLNTNVVIDWLRAKVGLLSEYLAYLARFDLCLRQSLGNLYRAEDQKLRLALALFLDFAHAQGLSAIELAALMHDPAREFIDALEFLLVHSVTHAAPTDDANDSPFDAWSDGVDSPT